MYGYDLCRVRHSETEVANLARVCALQYFSKCMHSHIWSIVRTSELRPEIAHLKCALYSGKYGTSSTSNCYAKEYIIVGGITSKYGNSALT